MGKIGRGTSQKRTVACSVILLAAAMSVAVGTGSAVGQVALPVPNKAAQPVIPGVLTSAMKAEVRASEQSVVLSWRGQGSDYLVIDDRSNRVVWRENSTTVRIPLAYSSSVDLVIVEMTTEGAKAVAEILATNPEPVSGLSPLIAVTTVDGTAVTWGAIEGVTSYRVTSGEPNSSQPLGDIVGEVVNVPTALGQSGRYEFISNNMAQRVAPGGAGEISPVTYSYGIEITPLSISTTRIPPTIKVGDSAPRPLAEKKLYSTNNSYETFIPAEFIDAPEDANGFTCEGGTGTDWWYSGDGRGVAPHSDIYRTKAAVDMNWRYHGSGPFRDVHPTKRYKKIDNNVLVYDSTRTASSDDFHLRTLSNDGQYARNVIEHRVGNPYCNSYSSITYHNQQDVYQNGGHWIYGSHDKMPDHEFYRYDYFAPDIIGPVVPDREEVTLVFHHPLEDPICLFGPACTTWRYQYVR